MCVVVLVTRPLLGLPRGKYFINKKTMGLTTNLTFHVSRCAPLVLSGSYCGSVTMEPMGKPLPPSTWVMTFLLLALPSMSGSIGGELWDLRHEDDPWACVMWKKCVSRIRGESPKLQRFHRAPKVHTFRKLFSVLWSLPLTKETLETSPGAAFTVPPPSSSSVTSISYTVSLICLLAPCSDRQRTSWVRCSSQN